VQENYLGGLVQDLALGYLNKSLRLITGHSPSIALCFAARNATTYTYLCDGSFRYGFGPASLRLPCSPLLRFQNGVPAGCYDQIVGPSRHLPKFADRLCRQPDARVCLDPHLIWQATKGYVKGGNAFRLVFHMARYLTANCRELLFHPRQSMNFHNFDGRLRYLQMRMALERFGCRFM
jgi:hypothetical protein